MRHDFQVPTIIGMQSNISLSTCLYWYPKLNSCKYLSETHLWNAQLNNDFSFNKGIVKICQIVDMVRKNWSWIVVPSCGLHYFSLASFGSIWVFADFSTAKNLNMFFAALKIHIMACIVKKQTNFIFSSLVT